MGPHTTVRVSSPHTPCQFLIRLLLSFSHQEMEMRSLLESQRLGQQSGK